jgi:hypothetical protein
MKNAFTSQQIAKMRDEYGKISTIDPSGPEYKQLIAMLDKMHIDNLKSLAGAKIKFVSGLAQNRVNRAAMKKEEVDLEEGKSAYEIYHKDYSSAVQTAIKQAEKRGFEVDMDDWHDKVATGPKKPSSGKTNSFSVKLKKDGKESKKALHLQVYNMDNHKYELNMYIEEVQLGESDAYDKNVKPSGKPHDKDAAAKRAVLAALAARKKMKAEEKHPEDVTTPANKQEPEGTKNWLATKKFKKEIKEAEGGGTSISGTGDASNSVKRAQVLLKSTQLRLKHEKEREAMAKQKQALQKEEEDKEYPEVKTGGKPLAKKFEKAFAKMGIKTNIKMKTVGNVSINEKEDKKEENGKEAPAKQKALKKGETLSGKQEPIKIDPEIESK